MTDIEKLNILKVLANETGLRIIRALDVSDQYVEKLAEIVGMTPATVCYHLKKMENAGLVRCTRSRFCMIYALNREIFSMNLSELITSDTEAVQTADEIRAEEDAVVLSHFMKNGKLLRFPAKQRKQEVVVRFLAKQFICGRAYPEAEVNEILSQYDDDICTLRRSLISFGYMTRENGIYRRTEKK